MIQKDDFIGSINRKAPDGLDVHGNPYRVLVVDDSAVMRKIIIQVLKSELFEIVGEAGDGEQAVNLYKELRPHLVTMDINMPKLDGLGALKKILQHDKDAQVIMLTSEGQKQTVVEAIAAGAKNYIVKPPERSKVLEKINSVIRPEK
ncbi:MAG: two-component system response regulator [Spirochaetes bacterium GWF1_41_5]|nr:MAG: two-component system response regulator [Spirochaetes bacterium GWF1_41_5]HBE01845.1 two-component system response regulator [Spirochaetia bacterium]